MVQRSFLAIAGHRSKQNRHAFNRRNAATDFGHVGVNTWATDHQ
jgi:hypothetical protein